MTHMTRVPTPYRVAAAVALAAALTAAAGTAGAQQATSTAPWRAWLGCWSAGAATPLGLDATMPLICVTPTASADVVQIATIVDGKVQATQTVDASGRDVPLDANGCSGSQSGLWSADGRRVYLRAAATCDGVLRTTSGILALTSQGEWLDIQGTSVGTDESVRISRYRDAGVRSTVPADIAERLRSTAMSVHGARVAAGATIGTAAVAEAVQATSVGVAEAFVLEREQGFDLDARALVALADAGVPTRITDAMIAASNPRIFAVRGARPIVGDSLSDDVAGRRIYVTMDRYNSPWGWGYDPYGSSYRYGSYGQYGYGQYGYGQYGYGQYGYPGYGYGGGVIIVRGPGDTGGSAHGRVVKGRGYQQGAAAAPSSSDRAVSRDRSAASSDRSSPSSSSGTSRGDSGSSSGSGSNSGSSDQRTAKPRP